MKLFCLVGPTGIGKTDIAIRLAKQFSLDVISADSRQIYKYMDIGTAKPRVPIRDRVTFHLIDIITPDILYSAADFARDCQKVIMRLNQNKRRFILVGGSGLYLKALFEPFFDAPARDLKLRKKLADEDINKLYERLQLVDPGSAQRIKPQDRQRIVRALEIYEQTRKPMSQHIEQTRQSDFTPYYVGLNMARNNLYEKINQRFDQMIQDGLVDEAKNLLKSGYTTAHNALNGIGYFEIIRFLNQEISLMQAIYLAKNRSRQYAKRQLTWFKKIEGVRWIEFSTLDQTVKRVGLEFEKYLSSF
ncbi:MAG: tRNA (adenosine(37)-N6)-dimethylallyltransferase MiaA [Candidatus Latescibacteria bacterium]|nr:tRNA (adenosine(37)-N6)-dimethylallyltransferase MiaA [Candidatus Latescibacterota bacterium]